MQSFLSTIEEMLEVKLQFNFIEHMQFYQFAMLETTIENGRTHKNELNKLLHTTIQKTENHTFQMQIESFDREHKNRNFSNSEKVFGARLAEINDDLSFVLSAKAEVKSVLQMTQLQQKVEQVMAKLNGKYVGDQVEHTFQYLRDFYQNEQRIVLDSKQYKQFGLLLNGYYGKHSAASQQTQMRRYANCMENTIANVLELATIRKIDEAAKEVHIQVTGSLAEPIYTPMFIKSMLEKNLAFDPEKDQPSLDKYEGLFVFDTDLGIVKDAAVSIAFSFGENYLKTIHYQLNAVNDAAHNN
jgi:hypothetical protein